MIKEVGSIFPLDSVYRPQTEPAVGSGCQEILLYSLCREALYDIAISLESENKKVLIPAYTCQTVISPFEEAGWRCHFYSIRRDLRIDTANLEEMVDSLEPALLVVHPYFGMELDSRETAALERISGSGVKIILDLTQCIFSVRRPSFVDFFVGSYRKWFPIPDGGFLMQNKGASRIDGPQIENEEFVCRQADAMYLRGLYFKNGDPQTKDISIRLSKLADRVAEQNISAHRMSDFSIRLKRQQDGQAIQKQRLDNYHFLHRSLKQGRGFSFVCTDLDRVTTAPLYFSVYAADRASLQGHLVRHRIYAPVIWPVENEQVLVSEDVRFIYSHLLAIPCDQRYDGDDMRRIVEVMNEYEDSSYRCQ